MKILTRILGIIVGLYGLLFACFTNIGPGPTNFFTGWSGTLLFFSGIGLVMLKEWARLVTIFLLVAVFSYSVYVLYSAKMSIIHFNTIIPLTLILYFFIPQVFQVFKK